MPGYLGEGFNARVYNTFVVSVLSYIWQFCEPNADLFAEEASAFARFPSGPGGWRSASDLYNLKALIGFPVEFVNLADAAWAAQLRVAGTVVTDYASLAQQLAEARVDNIALATKWRAWYFSHFATVLKNAVDQARPLRIGPAAVQSDLYRALRTHPDRRLQVETRFRQKLARWKAASPIGIVSRRMPAIFARLGKLVPPRVTAAVFRAQWNGWCTARRFQQEGACCFGCSHTARDCIEHYAHCRFVARLKNRFLRLREVSLDSFLCIGHADDATLALQALATDAVHVASNHFRGQSTPTATAVNDALEQWCKSGAAGHAALTRVFDSRWS